jgi:hypothetical protein
MELCLYYPVCLYSMLHPAPHIIMLNDNVIVDCRGVLANSQSLILVHRTVLGHKITEYAI